MRLWITTLFTVGILLKALDGGNYLFQRSGICYGSFDQNPHPFSILQSLPPKQFLIRLQDNGFVSSIHSEFFQIFRFKDLFNEEIETDAANQY